MHFCDSPQLESVPLSLAGEAQLKQTSSKHMTKVNQSDQASKQRMSGQIFRLCGTMKLPYGEVFITDGWVS